MRAVLLGLLIATTVIFAMLAIATPLMLRTQAADDRAYYQQFRQAAAYIDKNGHMPTPEQLRSMGWPPNSPVTSLVVGSADCDAPFEKLKSDRFVLGFWRGEWSECYAYPSGKTTLPMSVRSYILSGLWRNIILYGLIAGVAGWGAIRLIKRKRRAP
jgi:hypothetical protein